MQECTSLSGPRVTLQPLSRDHREQLLQAASDGELWNLKLTAVPSAETIDEYITEALAGRSNGTVIAYVTMVGNEIIGSTRFWKIDRKNRQMEIGHTWLAASRQRSFVNTEAKFLMLRYAFENLDCIRVQFTTDELNVRSRAAILRLGAVEEGIIRHERIMPDGRKRNSVRFSIIDSEWPAVRINLQEKLGLSTI
jgi:N-acetyltransferase